MCFQGWVTGGTTPVFEHISPKVVHFQHFLKVMWTWLLLRLRRKAFGEVKCENKTWPSAHEFHREAGLKFSPSIHLLRHHSCTKHRLYAQVVRPGTSLCSGHHTHVGLKHLLPLPAFPSFLNSTFPSSWLQCMSFLHWTSQDPTLVPLTLWIYKTVIPFK